MIKSTMLNLDSSLFIVIALVWILMIFLNKIYFKPVGQVIDEREAKIEKENNRIDEMTAQIEAQTEQIENVLKGAKKESLTIREELIKEGEKVREEIVDKARRETREAFAVKIKDMENQIVAAEEKLTREIESYSQKIKEIFI